MKKLLVCLPALALVIALSCSAQAEDGAVDSATLQAMGLGGMQVMSDSQAMNVRGKGFLTPGSASIAFGASYAHIGEVSIQGLGIFGIGAGSIDGYLADGQYMAGGSHLSEAGGSFSIVEDFEVKGLPATKTTTTYTLRVYAGGQSMSTSL